MVPGPVFVDGNRKYHPNCKVSDEQVLSAYLSLKSVKKVASIFGMCPQSIHERLVKLKAINPIRVFSDEEKQILCDEYVQHAETGNLPELARRLGRNRTYVVKQAAKLGLTRKAARISGGMIGRKHSLRLKQEISQMAFVRWHLEGHRPGKSVHAWKAGKREVGGRIIHFRSRWEANYARYLEWLKSIGNITNWEYEPKTFWFEGIKRGTRSYLPDFRITENNGSQAFHEVKGWMDPKSKTKIKRMRKYYPDVKLIVVSSKNYRSLEKMVCRLVPGWENS